MALIYNTFDIDKETGQKISIDTPEVTTFTKTFIGHKKGSITTRDEFAKLLSCAEIKWGVNLNGSKVTSYPTAIDDSLDLIQYALAVKNELDNYENNITITLAKVSLVDNVYTFSITSNKSGTISLSSTYGILSNDSIDVVKDTPVTCTLTNTNTISNPSISRTSYTTDTGSSVMNFVVSGFKPSTTYPITVTTDVGSFSSTSEVTTTYITSVDSYSKFSITVYNNGTTKIQPVIALTFMGIGDNISAVITAKYDDTHTASLSTGSIPGVENAAAYTNDDVTINPVTVTLSSIQWATTSGGTTAASTSAPSTLTGQYELVALYSDTSTKNVQATDIRAYTDSSTFTDDTYEDEWYKIPDTYYILGIYEGLTTTNTLSWVVTDAVFEYASWASTTGTSIAADSEPTISNDIMAFMSDGTSLVVPTSYPRTINVYSDEACTTIATNWYKTKGEYYIKASGTYNDQTYTTTNYLTWNVTSATVSSLVWNTTTGSSFKSASSMPIDSTLTATYTNNDTSTLAVSDVSITVYDSSNQDVTSTSWYNTVGEYKVSATYADVTTSTQLTWTVKEVTISSINWNGDRSISSSAVAEEPTAPRNIMVSYNDGSTSTQSPDSMTAYLSAASWSSDNEKDDWYSYVGTYYIKGYYKHKVTENYLVWKITDPEISYIWWENATGSSYTPGSTVSVDNELRAYYADGWSHKKIDYNSILVYAETDTTFSNPIDDWSTTVGKYRLKASYTDTTTNKTYISKNYVSWTVADNPINALHFKDIETNSTIMSLNSPTCPDMSFSFAYDGYTEDVTTDKSMLAYTSTNFTESPVDDWYSYVGTYYVKGYTTYNGKDYVTDEYITWTIIAATIKTLYWTTPLDQSSYVSDSQPEITNTLYGSYNTDGETEYDFSGVQPDSIQVYTNSECTTQANDGWYKTSGTYYIKANYSDKTSDNYLTWIVLDNSLASLSWDKSDDTISSVASSTAPSYTSKINNTLTGKYSDGTSTSVDLSDASIIVYSNSGCTTQANDEWYKTAGTYYVKAKYSNVETSNYITWTVTAAVVSSLSWESTTGNSDQSTTQPTISNTIKVVMSNGTTTTGAKPYQIIAYSNSTCTTSVDNWYNTPGTYYIKGYISGSDIATSNYITWKVNAVLTGISWSATSVAYTEVSSSAASQPTLPNIILTYSDESTQSLEASSATVTVKDSDNSTSTDWHANPGTYTATATYNGFTTSNTLTITINASGSKYYLYAGLTLPTADNYTSISSYESVSSLAESSLNNTSYSMKNGDVLYLLCPNGWLDDDTRKSCITDGTFTYKFQHEFDTTTISGYSIYNSATITGGKCTWTLKF